MSFKLNNKYSLLQYFLIVALCLLLVFSIFSEPITVQAVSSYDFAYSLALSLFANGFSSISNPDNFQSLYTSTVDFISSLTGSFYDEFYEVFGLLEIYTDVNGASYFELDDDIQKWILHLMSEVVNHPFYQFRSQLTHSSVDLDSLDSFYYPSYGYGDELHDVLLKDGFVPLQLKTRIYIPSQELVESGSLITQDQILSGEFEQLQVPDVVSPTVFDYLREVSSHIHNLNLKLDRIISYFGSRLQEYSYEIDSKLTVMSSQIELNLSYLSDRLTDYLSEVSNRLSLLRVDIDKLTSYMRTEVVQEIRAVYKQIQLLSPTFDSIVTELQTLNEGFVLLPDYFEDLKTTIESSISSFQLPAYYPQLDQLIGYLRTEIVYEIRGAALNALKLVPSVDLVYQKVDQLIGYMRTEVLWEIRDVALKVGTLKTTFETQIEDLELKLGQIYDSILELPDLIAQKTAEVIWMQQLLDSTPIQTVKESFLNVTQSLTYLPQFLSPSDDDDRPTFFDFLFGRGEGAGIWEFLSDNTFVAGLSSFFTFVSSLWYIFPAGIKYLVSFGFAFPFFFSTLKMFAG